MKECEEVHIQHVKIGLKELTKALLQWTIRGFLFHNFWPNPGNSVNIDILTKHAALTMHQ